MAPDKESAEKFLTLLDEEAVGFTFQTFDDDKERKDSSLAKVFNGPLDQHFDSLAALSSRGAGVFVTVNQTDLKGRKAENIVAVRAIFQEVDRGGVPIPALDPHIVVESSPGKFHRYWLVEKSTDFDRFQGCMRRMVEDFGSDPNAADVARVLRLPGFLHQKFADRPHMVRIVQTSSALPYSWQTLISQIPPLEPQARVDIHAIRALPGTHITEPMKVRSALRALDPDSEYKPWLEIGMALHHASGGSGEGFALWDAWSAAGNSYREGETAYKWRSFGHNKGASVTLGSLFHLATKVGWDWERERLSLLPEVTRILEEAVVTAAADPECVWQPDVLEALSMLRSVDPAGYERIRVRLKNANRRIRLAELDRLARVEGGGDDRPSLASEMVTLAEERCEFWHDADGVGYATFQRGGHDEHWKLGSTGFQEWLSWLAYSMLEKSPSREVLNSVVNALSGIAKFDGEEHSVHMRVAGSDGDYWLDLGDEDWRAVHITATGWRLETKPSVRFIRTKAMRALPVPVCGGEIDRLWNFINLQDTDRLMFLAWMLEALRPDTPYLIMELVGEQGSAKSSSQRCVLQLLNPTQVPLKAAPKQREDIFVAARNNAVVSFENLSSLSVEFQDALCTLATGGGFSTRLFFTNDEEAILEVKRPVILNGISQVITRQDLLDRALTFSLPTVDGKRRTEQELGAEFNDLLPKLLGGLLDLFVAVLATLPQVRIPQAELPRMADFALLGEALYQVQGKSQGAFLSEYLERRVDAVQRTIESSPVALVAIEWLKEHRKGYRGTVKGLFIALNSMMFDIERGEYWPKTPKGFADAFRRVAPSLRILGIDAQFLPKRQRDGYHCILVRNADAPQVPAETRGKEVHDIHPGTQAVDEIQDIQVEA